MSLNYYAINKFLGGTMTPTRRQTFGGFGTLPTVSDALRHRPRKPKPIAFTYEKDALVADAFEQVRAGMSPERILWDTKLATKFHARARRLGVHAPSAQLDRRLILIRKNPSRYRQHGIELSETTVTDPQPSIIPEFAHVLEFALVRLRNRYGASIDDILLEPELVQEYERIAKTVAKELTSTELRLGALYIRKTRHVARAEERLFEDLDTSRMDSQFSELGTLDRISTQGIPAGEGLIEVLENGRYLYISRNENLRSVVREFVRGPTLDVMANHFWTPKRESIALRVFHGDRFDDTSIHRWQLKLIRERSPIFNWPVQAA
jgi:hypothetical protein